MNDLVTTGLAAGGIIASRDLLNKLLGPSAEYLGEKAAGLVRKCDVNLNNIFRIAIQKIGKRIDEPGCVNPRVLKHVIDEGRFVEDELMAEYFGGVLASARTENGRDDRATAMLKILESMSAYDVRLHYVFYTILRRVFSKEPNISLNKCSISAFTGFPTLRGEVAPLFISFETLFETFDFSEKENAFQIIRGSYISLCHQNLLTLMLLGPKNHLSQVFPKVSSDGLISSPTLFGCKLYLWVHGFGGLDPQSILDMRIELTEKSEITIPETDYCPATSIG